MPGRVLNSPAVNYGNKKSLKTHFGSWNLQNVQFVTKADLLAWTWLYIATPSSASPWNTPEELKVTLGAFTTLLRETGINCNTCLNGLRINVTLDDFETKIDEAFRKFASAKEPPKLVLVILGAENKEYYNCVKYVADIKQGVINVCVVAKKFAKPNNAQYFANVSTKFNLKLGGRNHSISPEKLAFVSLGKTMIVGLDVTHPAPGSLSTAPSVVGIVASVDQWLAQWPADIMIQERRKEMISGLKTLMKGRLALWQRHNQGSLPDYILVYRDGVSEGQYKIVLDEELPLIRAACTEVYPATMSDKKLPRITIIIVGKRHNTRFYPTKENEADRSLNPQNGTVVDRGVTEARKWDFFLQAHTAIQGTARPAHYYIVHDEIFREWQKVQPKPARLPQFQNAADALEDLTHNLCYLFGRATKAVSICPPAYYADLVCDRARLYLSGLFDPPASSAASGNTGQAGPQQSMVSIHERVRDTMFYI